MKMKISLPDATGALSDYVLQGTPIEPVRLSADPVRVVFSAAHVVADPFAPGDPSGPATLDWDATMAFRRHLAGLGLGIAEAMDTAQRGMGLDWPGALELITRTRAELPDALVFNGCGTDQLDPADARDPDDVRRAYLEQVEAIQTLGGRLIIMASRALARVARTPEDYLAVYRDVLSAADQPVILHWLGEMFDPQLRGYWGSDNFDATLETALQVIEDSPGKVDGIKISLLDKEKEIVMRRRLPEGVRMYTGDDFNYPELIAGDDLGYSDALLGVFDPLAVAVGKAVSRLQAGDAQGFRATLDPTVPLARLIFRAPTQYYKTGVVFLAWLNGHQEHFVMLGGAQAMRPLPYFCDCFRMADQCGLLADPELAIARMRGFWGFTVLRDFSNDLKALALNTATIGHNLDGFGAGWPVERVVDACAERGIGGIVFWRREIGNRAVEIGERVRATGLKVAGLCRTPYLTGAEAPATLDEARASVDMAAALGTDVLTIVTGGTEPGTKGVLESQKVLAERVAALADYAAPLGVNLALEPLNPMFGGNRTCLFTVAEALSVCEAAGATNVGVAVDVYHVWWDTGLGEALKAGGKGRVLGYHLCDWLHDTSDMLLDRGMMGDGVADLKAIRQCVENAGFNGICEVEVFSAHTWWLKDPGEVLDTMIERFRTVC